MTLTRLGDAAVSVALSPRKNRRGRKELGAKATAMQVWFLDKNARWAINNISPNQYVSIECDLEPSENGMVRLIARDGLEFVTDGE
jgi:hypothetical protein